MYRVTTLFSILRWHCLLFTLLCAPSYKVALAFKTGAEVIQSYQVSSIRIPFLFENEDFFSGLAYRLHVSGENGNRIPICSKTLTRVGILENAFLLYGVWMDENGSFWKR